GPDGYVYIGTGDGGSGNDPQGNGQKLNTYLAKMLRIDVDNGSPYVVLPIIHLSVLPMLIPKYGLMVYVIPGVLASTASMATYG
ncbi:MAG: hypothetical protein ACK570_02610, partial [Bacteroidota bacterium]